MERESIWSIELLPSKPFRKIYRGYCEMWFSIQTVVAMELEPHNSIEYYFDGPGILQGF